MPAVEAWVTVRALWDLALPPGSVLAAGEQGLDCRVEWVATLRASYPMFGDLGEGYLALARLQVARSLDPDITAGRLIEALAQAHAAALVLDEPLTPADITLADSLSLPVFVTPADTDLRQLERDILRALVDREGQMALREMAARRALQQAYDREGLQGLADALARAVGGQVSILDAQGHTQISAGEAPHKPGPAIEFSIQGSGRALGRLVVASASGASRGLDALQARGAAEICAVDMLQQVARQETEERLGADLVEQLLAATPDPEALNARLERLGYPLTPHSRHVALALSCDADAPTPSQETALDLRQALQPLMLHTLQLRYRNNALLLCALHPNTSERRLRQILSSRATRIAPGIGRLGAGLEGLRDSVRQALDACALGSRLNDRPGPYHYDDLGLYRLLAGLHHPASGPARAEVQRFHTETLGALLQYDGEHDADLVRTLAVYFGENGNTSRAAERLSVHRNTLSYRLRRIVEITGLDLEDPETRLALQVALAIHRLTSADLR